MSKPLLSGVVVCQNNEATIGAVVDQLAGVCDEVVVVDGGSTDATCDVASERPGVRLFRRPFDGSIARQKNFAYDQARGRWIFILDSDELMGAAGLRAVPMLVRVPFASWFSFPRYWLVEQGGEIRYIADRPFYRDRQVRLFRNRAPFRYRSDSSQIHHLFLEDRLGFGRPLRRFHIFHYDFLLHDRARRERKVDFYRRVDPGSEEIHRRYLWEDWDVRLERVPEPLPGMLHGGAD